MVFKRRNRGFEQAGRVSLAELGVPTRKARELTIQRAWRGVAGELVARNTSVISFQRGRLTVSARDASWTTALLPMLPELGGRLDAGWPKLGIVKLRLCGPDGADAGTVTRTEFVLPVSTDPAPDRPRAPKTDDRRREGDLGARLRAVEAGYLARRDSEGVAGGEE